MNNTKAERFRVGWALTLGLGLIAAPSIARAEELKKFSGYTRPGIPTAPPGPIKIAGDKAAQDAIGATVYFKVFERGNDDEVDPWGTGIKDLDRWFVPGRAARGRNAESLDTSARYLYLYQVVNDSYRPAQVKSVAIRLLIPPHLITSWGHFVQRADKGAARGFGFTMLFDHPDPKTPKAKSMVLPLSTDHAGVNDELYRDPAPYFYPPKPYGISPILLNNKPMPLTDGEDTGRAPERVMLHSMFNFEGAPNWLVKDKVAMPLMPFTRPALPGVNLGNPFFNPMMPAGMGAMGMAPGMPGMMAGNGVGPGVDPRHAPAVAAYWNDDPLRPGVAGVQPGQRSTIFGFTSNFPPVYEDVRVRGNVPPPFKGPAAPAADGGSANLRADGEVPTPVAFEQCIPPLGHAPGSFGGPIGQVGAGGGLLRGGGGFGGGFGFGFPFGGGGAGGGGMMGGGAGSGTGSSSPTTSTATASPVATGALLALLLSRLPLTSQTQAVNVNVAQSQSQAQAQAQSQAQAQAQAQSQSQHVGHHGHVVPEPAAVVSALLGLPGLALLIRRRKKTAGLPV